MNIIEDDEDDVNVDDELSDEINPEQGGRKKISNHLNIYTFQNIERVM